MFNLLPLLTLIRFFLPYKTINIHTKKILNYFFNLEWLDAALIVLQVNFYLILGTILKVHILPLLLCLWSNGLCPKDSKAAKIIISS